MNSTALSFTYKTNVQQKIPKAEQNSPGCHKQWCIVDFLCLGHKYNSKKGYAKQIFPFQCNNTRNYLFFHLIFLLFLRNTAKNKKTSQKANIRVDASLGWLTNNWNDVCALMAGGKAKERWSFCGLAQSSERGVACALRKILWKDPSTNMYCFSALFVTKKISFWYEAEKEMKLDSKHLFH